MIEPKVKELQRKHKLSGYELFCLYGSHIGKRPNEMAIEDVEQFIEIRSKPDWYREMTGARPASISL